MNSTEIPMVKVKSVEVKRLSGMRGFTVVLPWSWVSDVDLSRGDYVDIYRDVKDRLVLIHRKVVDGPANGESQERGKNRGRIV